MKTAIRIIAGLCAIAAFAAAGLFGSDYVLSRGTSGEASGGAQRGGPTQVGVAQVQSRQIEEAVTAVGTVSPVRRVEIRPTVPGRVTQVSASSGQQVQPDALLVQLDDRAERATVAGAEATLAEARQNLERVEELAEANTAAERRLETARAAFERAESDAMAARAALEDRRITAPFGGTLGLVDVDPGAYLTPQNVIATLSDLATVRVDLALPERYFGDVKVGQSVDITVPAYSDETFQGAVKTREHAVTLGSRSFQVRVDIDNSDRKLVGGMLAQTKLIFETYEGLAVPDDAIISEGDRTYVYAVADGKAQQRDIEVGRSLDALTEVTEGLEADTRVVVTGWSTLRDGAAVSVKEEIAREGLE